MSDEQRDEHRDDHRDELPADLDAAGYVGPYQFPDNSRRRIAAVVYLGVAAACLILWAARREQWAFVNDGFVVAAIALGAVAMFSITSGWRMTVREVDALVAAQRAVGFAVGHASAQQVWRGLRSRPTWRVLCYSAEEPPHQRGLVLVDAVDGTVVEQLVEENPERWDDAMQRSSATQAGPRSSATQAGPRSSATQAGPRSSAMQAGPTGPDPPARGE